MADKKKNRRTKQMESLPTVDNWKVWHLSQLILKFLWNSLIYIFLLKYGWFTMFQVHSKVIQLYIYTYIIFEIMHFLLKDKKDL